VSQLYKNNSIDALEKVVKNGTPYLGTSAGSNICGLTISTTNDMPIVYPPSFRTLGFVSFNINPHYLDPIEGSTHMGETRETRINEFHQFNPQPVIGLREGSWLAVNGDSIKLKGNLTARIFKRNEKPIEVDPETELKDLK
jgi:dipeptidase E